MTIVICVKRKANIFISEELSLECVLTGDNTDVLSTFTDMTNMLNVFNPSTFYSSLRRADWLKLHILFYADQIAENNVGNTFLISCDPKN